MDERLQRLLDGAMAPGEADAFLATLDEAGRAEARRLLRLVRGARALAAPTSPPGFTEGVMARVRAGAAPRRTLWTWLSTPRLSPLGALGAATAAAVLALLLGRPFPLPASSPREPELVVARLTLVAPQARRVAVAGDFNGWSLDAAPMRRGPGGAWSGEVQLPRGRHQYMFVVDGRWVTDPAAGATLDDGFGNRNALLDL